MTQVRCVHDLLSGQCAICLGRTGIEEELAAERAALLVQPGWIRARYSGICAGCEEPYAPGSAIHASPARGSRRWIAECCAATLGASRDTDDTHRCPGGCSRRVQSHLFACAGCWGRLPFELQQAIRQNYRRDATAHAAAMTAARDWYRAHLGVRT